MNKYVVSHMNKNLTVKFIKSLDGIAVTEVGEHFLIHQYFYMLVHLYVCKNVRHFFTTHISTIINSFAL